MGNVGRTIGVGASPAGSVLARPLFWRCNGII